MHVRLDVGRAQQGPADVDLTANPPDPLGNGASASDRRERAVVDEQVDEFAVEPAAPDYE